ncbi:M3 family oligoendopeptidase [Vibrio amylolyticus]|uniref:M3 family oligoendopeptidase n=1 Tax=Vibrio amylolyticus TaxID=2847292 RepID=UPI00354E90D2
MTAPSWDLTIAYHGLDDSKIEQDIALIEQCIDVLKQHIANREQVLVMQNAVQTSEAAGTLMATINTFATCHASVDSSNEVAKSLMGRIAKLNSSLTQAFAPYTDTLTHSDDVFIEDVLAHSSADVSGQYFQFSCLRKLADSKLSVAEEQLITALEVDGKDAWGRMYDNLTGTLEVKVTQPDGSIEQMGFSQAASLLYGSDFEKQPAAWQAIQEAMDTHKESFASVVNALAGWRLTEIEKRSTKHNIHFLEPSLHDSRITEQTLDTMMSVAKANRSVGQKAGKLMAKVHQLDEMKPWNHLASMPSLNLGSDDNDNAQSNEPKVYSFDEAITVIRSAFSEVDEEMAEFVDIMVENGWIDAEPSNQRRLGAYCTKLAATRSPLVFMTWGGSRSDLLTLAHELGHAFHNWVMKDMPLCKTRYPMTLAETASIFAENIVRDYLLSKASSRTEKLEMLWEELSSCYALMVNIPVRFAFEKEFYEKRQSGELSANELSELMSKHWQDWYGDSMSQSDPYFWASKLHFSISEVSFYNYPYLFGYLFSIGVYAQREHKGDAFYRDYLSLLRDTGSMNAEEVVEKHLGMSLSSEEFWQQSIDRVSAKVDLFETLLSDK